MFSKGERVDDEHPLQEEDQQLAEVVIIRGSPLENATLGQINFNKRFNVETIALHRAGTAVDTKRRGLGGIKAFGASSGFDGLRGIRSFKAFAA